MKSTILEFKPAETDNESDKLREEVREFIDGTKGDRNLTLSAWEDFDSAFSQAIGKQGYIGMTWPKEYGGAERSPLERHIVLEELMAAGVPLGAHWVADRQSGNQILKHAQHDVKTDILPRIARGECYFGIGMSEPGSGSDLASVRTRAEKVGGGWKISGTKLWTTNAHRVHYIILLARTAAVSPENRRAGLTQFIIDMNTPGITVNPVLNLAGQHEFNEILLDEAFVPDTHILGSEGQGWELVTGELGYERSGPDRFCSMSQMFFETAKQIEKHGNAQDKQDLGRLVAHLTSLRRMSLSVAGMLQSGEIVAAEASLVKDLGTQFEQEIPELARRLAVGSNNGGARDAAFDEVVRIGLLKAPCVTLRGGTTEILRGIVAKELGLR